MPSGTARRKAKTGLPFYYLQNAVDFHILQAKLRTLGFNTSVKHYTDANGAAAWDVEITNARPDADQVPPQERQMTMRLGQVAVWDPEVNRLSIMSVETALTNYDNIVYV